MSSRRGARIGLRDLGPRTEELVPAVVGRSDIAVHVARSSRTVRSDFKRTACSQVPSRTVSLGRVLRLEPFEPRQRHETPPTRPRCCRSGYFAIRGLLSSSPPPQARFPRIRGLPASGLTGPSGHQSGSRTGRSDRWQCQMHKREHPPRGVGVERRYQAKGRARPAVASTGSCVV